MSFHSMTPWHHVAETDVIHLDDVGVRQHGDCLGFVFKAADKLLVVEELVLQDFDGNLTVIEGVGTAVYIRHAADADQLVDFITAVKALAKIFIHLSNSFLVDDGGGNVVGTAAFFCAVYQFIDEGFSPVLVANLHHVAR